MQALYQRPPAPSAPSLRPLAIPCLWPSFLLSLCSFPWYGQANIDNLCPHP